jgi:hypothetical protein
MYGLWGFLPAVLLAASLETGSRFLPGTSANCRTARAPLQLGAAGVRWRPAGPVNPLVVGSIPTRGASEIKYLQYSDRLSSTLEKPSGSSMVAVAFELPVDSCGSR